MPIGHDEHDIPTGHDAIERWGELGVTTRFGLVFGARKPQSGGEALTALGFAREMRKLRAIHLVLLAAGVTAIWATLALLTDTFTPLGLLPAFGFAFGFGWLGRVLVASGLERGARQTLDTS